MKPTLVILCLSPLLFGLGAIAMAIANEKVELQTRRNRWMKFWSYLIVVYLVIFAIILGSKVFAGFIIAVLILASGVIGTLFMLDAFIFGFHSAMFYLAAGVFTLANCEGLLLMLIRSEVNEHVGSILRKHPLMQ